MTTKGPSAGGSGLTKEQEASLVYRLEQEPDLWLILLREFVLSRGEDAAALRAGLIDDVPEWRARVAAARQQGLAALKDLACTQPVQWNFRVRQLLGDPEQVTLFTFHLRNLAALKTRKVREIGARAEAQRRLNAALAAVAKEALASLDKFNTATSFLARGRTTGGKPLTLQARAFYAAMQSENAAQVAVLVGLTLLLQQAVAPAERRRLQGFIRDNLVEPMKARAGTLSKPQEKQLQDRIAKYRRLLEAVELAD